MYFVGTSAHMYSFYMDGVKKPIDKLFNSRDAANNLMYELCGKYGLHIEEVYDDHHDKTYKCNKGVSFHINRM